MSVRVLNINGDQIELSQQTKSALNSLASEADKPNANWDELSHKMLHALEGDGFEITKLQPEIHYHDSKKGKKIVRIKIDYTGK